jgi:spermidine synthase
MNPRLPLTLSAALLSGAAALVHQVVWVRRVGDLVGHGAVAVAVVLAVFFAGLGLGARLFGGVSDRVARVGLWYAALEVAIAGYGLCFLALVGRLEDAVLALGPAAGEGPAAVLVAVVLLLPPSILLGGTLPALVRLGLGGAAPAFGRRLALVYGCNTLGAAAGAAVAGFVLLPALGLGAALGVAAAANLVAAGLVAPLRAAAPRSGPESGSPAPGSPEPPRPVAMPRRWLAAAAVSGLVGIGLEVVWTRALAARLSSTVYSFSILLTVFLAALGLGSLLVGWWDRRRGLGARAVGLLLVGTAFAGIASTASIEAFGGLRRAAGADLGAVQRREVLTAFLVMLPPCLCLGATFPAVARAAHRSARAAGAEVGRVYLANTLGSIVGALGVGFVALPLLGLTGTVLALAALAAGAGILLLPRPAAPGLRPLRFHLGAGLAVLAAALALTTDLRLWQRSPGDRLVAYREGRAASVSVVDQADGNFVLKVDQTYRLGGVRGRYPQARQGLVPLLLHGDARSMLSLGVGTGGSVGAAVALGRPDGAALRVDAVEILPEVLEVLPLFDRWNHELTARAAVDPGIRLIAADARHFVRRAAAGSYDLVVGDLFVPWRPGEGAMYTREHFEAVRRVLRPGGLFVQWLPVYQLGLAELRVIAATFVAVFPDAAVVWLYQNARTPTIGLCGTPAGALQVHADLERFWADEAGARLLSGVGLDGAADLLALWLCGPEPLSAFAAGAALETLERPRVEFSAAAGQPLPRGTLADLGLQALLPLSTGIESLAAALDEPLREAGRARQRAVAALLEAGCAREYGFGAAAEIRACLDAVRADRGFAPAAEALRRAVGDALRARRFDEVRGVVAACAAEPELAVEGLRLAAALHEAEGAREAAIAACRAVLVRDPEDARTRALLERLER